ncbi:MAG: DEAD/DEAH box helicase [Armatimonadetes bacterium]|nr:DEAD/DEAH box helicase [Armatimonadota bacterium]
MKENRRVIGNWVPAMNFQAFLNEIRASPGYAGQIVHVREVPARPAAYAEPERPLSPPLRALLASRGIARLYTHQAEALDRAREGRSVLVVTGTASGKTLCYVAPILETLAGAEGAAPPPEGGAAALLLFPTKALCQDQCRGFREALAGAGLSRALAGVYDADTPPATRRRLRNHASVIFTNPDMLHAALMPQHARWGPFLSRLRWLVLDEVHVYSGLFGSNMANVLRRFRRLCRHYGAAPQTIGCSGTIGNPKALMEALIEEEVAVVARDGSPRGRRTYVFWNPVRLPGPGSPPSSSSSSESESRTRARARTRTSNRAATGRRRSANVEAHELMAALIERGAPTITFSKAKMTAEMIHRYVTETLQRTAPPLARKVAPYRGGYLAVERREIERRLFTGELMGVSTTPALELGIDVGGLDAAILVGYPGTLASFYQQSGRAGRQGRDALVVLVGLDTPANQYIMGAPEYLFGRPVEQGLVDADNPFVTTGHLRCAAHELPLADSEAPGFGRHAQTVLRLLEENRKLNHLEGHWYHAASETPQHAVSLRSDAGRNVVIQDVETGFVLGEVVEHDAPPLLHPEAIYMHLGETYRVLELDLERAIAGVRRVEVDYYTQALGGSDVHHIDHCLRERPFGSGRACWGEVTAYFDTYAYERIHFYSLDAISRHGVDLPTLALETMALWIIPPEALVQSVRRAGLDAHAGLRGVGYATRTILPLFITCDTPDFSHTVGSANSPWQAIFVYERFPHGLGFTQRAYEELHRILPAVLQMIRDCPCADGCPCCVGKPLRPFTVWNVERGEGSIPSKAAARMILEGLLGDGSRLETADIQALTDGPAGETERLEWALRRRLERMREPQVFHPIRPEVETAYPEIEKPETLPEPDVARRATRRREFERALRKRIALLVDPSPPGPPWPAVTPASRDSLAARARRLKKDRDRPA